MVPVSIWPSIAVCRHHCHILRSPEHASPRPPETRISGRELRRRRREYLDSRTGYGLLPDVRVRSISSVCANRVRFGSLTFSLHRQVPPAQRSLSLRGYDSVFVLNPPPPLHTMLRRISHSQLSSEMSRSVLPSIPWHHGTPGGWDLRRCSYCWGISARRPLRASFGGGPTPFGRRNNSEAQRTFPVHGRTHACGRLCGMPSCLRSCTELSLCQNRFIQLSRLKSMHSGCPASVGSAFAKG